MFAGVRGFARVPVVTKLTSVLYFCYKWLIYAPFAVLATVITCTIAIVASPFVSTRALNTHIVNRWGRLVCWAVPLRVTFEGREHLDNNQSYVIVANHLSQLDIPILYGWLGREIVWMMKKELRNMPFIGAGANALGHIFVDRNNMASALASLEAAKPSLAQGKSVIFFPEGTRSRGSLLPFKRGAFRVALDLGIPILPISIIDTDLILPTNSVDLHYGSVRIVVHPPIAVNPETDTDVQLAKRARDVVASALPARYLGRS